MERMVDPLHASDGSKDANDPADVVNATDLRLEETIATLLSKRAQDATICPSDAARAIGGEEWRDLMEPSRRAARRMVARGELEITQGGSVVDPSTAKGPIRLRRPR
jgi:hypothetical protein